MKILKLNKKGFTLIELLAIIVILAIILIVTIPQILDTVGNAKKSSFDTAVKTIENYVQQEYDKCNIGDTTVTGSYNTAIFTENTCNLITGYSDIVIPAANYLITDIASVTMTITNGKVKISAATPGINGKFKGVVPYSAS